MEWLTEWLLIQMTIFDLTYRLPLKIHFQMFTRREMSLTLSYSPSLGALEKMQQGMLRSSACAAFSCVIIHAVSCTIESRWMWWRKSYFFPTCKAQFEEEGSIDMQWIIMLIWKILSSLLIWKLSDCLKHNNYNSKS